MGRVLVETCVGLIGSGQFGFSRMLDMSAAPLRLCTDIIKDGGCSSRWDNYGFEDDCGPGVCPNHIVGLRIITEVQ